MNNSKINILPDYIANQIAAGEVVQRPESVVKEIVENSLDAGSDEISIMITNAGKQLIHIADNGIGMSYDDLELSIRRHATSKIITQKDLESIFTYGFRGEALASISAVANLEIKTKRAEEEHGWKLLMKPGEQPIIEADNTTNGTQIFVRNLFYNVPARRKFLKSNLTEFKHIHDTLIKIAFANQNTKIIFIDGKDVVFQVEKSSLEDRVSSLLGESYKNSLMKIDYESGNYKLSGFLGKPQLAKKTKAGQYLYINGRPIQNNALAYAVFTEFEHLLESNYKPFFIIFIEVDPRKVDINVHPQKHEVKFDDDRIIYQIFREAVRNCLAKYDLSHNSSDFIDSDFTPFELKKHDSNTDSDTILINKITGEIIEENNEKGPYNKNSKHRNSHNTGKFTKKEYYDKKQINDSIELIYNREDNLLDLNQKTKYRIISIDRNYYTINTGTDFIIIDINAAYKRVIYDTIIHSHNKKDHTTQNLLFPESLAIEAANKMLIKDILPYLETIGFSIELKDLTGYIHGVPDYLKSADAIKIVNRIFQEPELFLSSNLEDILELIALELSSNIRLNSEKLKEDEVTEIYEELLKTNMPQITPNGKLIFQKLKIEDLPKKFERGKIFE